MKNLQTNIINDILDIANKATSNALKAINTQLVIRNWLIGKRIHEEILTTRSNDYGKGLIKNLSKALKGNGKYFDKRSLYQYLGFYQTYSKIVGTVCPLSSKILNFALPWTLYRRISRIKNIEEVKWYTVQAKVGLWSYRQLDRNIKTDMYHRVISNQIDTNCKQLVDRNNNDYLKSIMILEFLGLKKDGKYKETQLEQALIDNLTKFMIELGNGYTFKARQYHLRTNNNDYYIDLVFYNTILKRYLLIDLKVGEKKHKDIGQMLFYLRLFDKQNNIDESSKSIGMILSSDLNSDIVKYLMDKTKDNVVASKYLTYLPTKEEIRKELEKIFQ